MIDKFIDKEEISNEDVTIINNNLEAIISEIDHYFDEFSSNDNENLLMKIVRIYQVFSYDLLNTSPYVRNKIYLLYTRSIKEWIKNENYFTIYLLMDLFYCDKYLLSEIEKSDNFIKESYSILNIETSDMSSYIAIASLRLISIIESENKINFLKKYFSEHPEGNYIEDVKEAIENIED